VPTQPSRLARVNKRELADVPAAWTEPERGQYLRLLLRGKGIDPDRLFRVEYHPRRHCWLVIQDPPPSAGFVPRLSQPGHSAADAALYREVMNLFRRTAQAAFAALAAQSSHFA